MSCIADVGHAEREIYTGASALLIRGFSHPSTAHASSDFLAEGAEEAWFVSIVVQAFFDYLDEARFAKLCHHGGGYRKPLRLTCPKMASDWREEFHSLTHNRHMVRSSAGTQHVESPVESIRTETRRVFSLSLSAMPCNNSLGPLGSTQAVCEGRFLSHHP
jgi:hypothetical protein